MSVRVLVVDDQAMVRAGFAALLDAQPDIEVVGQAADGAEGVRLAAETRPDVVLMDVRMPVLDGIEATRTILADRGAPPPKIVVLTTFDVDDYVLEALRAGASGFLLKDALPDDLVEAVRIVARGDALLSPSVTRRLIERFAARPTGTTAIGSDLDVLTDREREVLREVAQGRSNGEIAAVLFIAEQTVKSHVSRVLTKLGLRDRAQAVVVAYESGLVVPGD
ncbi:response regulator [Amnibacterium sp.]|uniref:response regulator n=1 Tax=Amnibacterium sp. TaxID=1872496 RepID=UPI003F7CCF70